MRTVFQYFLLWNLVVILISGISSTFLSERDRFVYKEDPKLGVNPQFLWNRANFDGIHYLAIARHGYGVHQQAFFPLYPNLIRYLSPLVGGRDLLVGVAVSISASLSFLFLLYQLVKLDFEDKIAKRAALWFLLFPTSFYLGLVYTEGLFLTLILGSFYAARKGQWWLAGVLGGLAAHTRLVGIFLFPALGWEFYHQELQGLKRPLKLSKVSNILPLLLVPLGLVTYMVYLAEKYHDALMFVRVQPFFGAERSEKIILLYQVFWRYLKMIMTTKWDPLYFAVWLELGTVLLFIFLLYQAFRKGLRTSYLLFSVLAFLVPTLTGTFSSLPRYVLVLFPGFIGLGLVESKRLRFLIAVIFGLLFLISTAFFFRGYWVA